MAQFPTSYLIHTPQYNVRQWIHTADSNCQNSMCAFSLNYSTILFSFSILNKLTPDNFERLSTELMRLSSRETLKGSILLVCHMIVTWYLHGYHMIVTQHLYDVYRKLQHSCSIRYRVTSITTNQHWSRSMNSNLSHAHTDGHGFSWTSSQ